MKILQGRELFALDLMLSLVKRNAEEGQRTLVIRQFHNCPRLIAMDCRGGGGGGSVLVQAAVYLYWSWPPGLPLPFEP